MILRIVQKEQEAFVLSEACGSEKADILTHR